MTNLDRIRELFPTTELEQKAMQFFTDMTTTLAELQADYIDNLPIYVRIANKLHTMIDQMLGLADRYGKMGNSVLVHGAHPDVRAIIEAQQTNLQEFIDSIYSERHKQLLTELHEDDPSMFPSYEEYERSVKGGPTATPQGLDDLIAEIMATAQPFIGDNPEVTEDVEEQLREQLEPEVEEDTE